MLLLGTLIPGVWRNALQASLQAPYPLAKLAHLLIFMVMAFVVRVSDQAWSRPMVLLAEKGSVPFLPLTCARFTTAVGPAPGKTPSPHAGNIKCHAASLHSHKVLPNCGTRDLARAAIH